MKRSLFNNQDRGQESLNQQYYRKKDTMRNNTYRKK